MVERRTTVAAWLVLGLAGLTLAGCARATPLCDQAEQLAGRGQLAEATELYARARQMDEGDCADNGLQYAGKAYVDAAGAVVQGNRAETAGDTAGAIEAYRDALRRDDANANALAGMARLGQGPKRATATVINVPTSPSPSWWQTTWPILIGAGLVVLLAAVGSSLLYRRSRRAEECLTELAEKLETRMNTLQGETHAVDHKVDRFEAAWDKQLNELRAAVTSDVEHQVEAVRQHQQNTEDEFVRRQHDVGDRVERLNNAIEELRPSVRQDRGGRRDTEPVSAVSGPNAAPKIEPADMPAKEPVVAVWREPASPKATSRPRRDDVPEIAELEIEGERDALSVVIVRCRGVQVGEGTRQVNVFEYRVEAPEVDFSALMKRPSMARALRHLAANPEDPDAVRDAERALGTGPLLFGRSSQQAVDQSLKSLDNPKKQQFWDFADGTIIVRRSQNVQIGSGGRQNNSFVYTISPHLDALALLAEEPRIVAAFVDVVRMQGKKAPVAVLDRALQSTVTRAVDAGARDLSGRGVAYPRPHSGEVLRITGAHGASVGDDIRQDNLVKAVPISRLAASVPTIKPAPKTPAPRRSSDLPRNGDINPDRLEDRARSPRSPGLRGPTIGGPSLSMRSSRDDGWDYER